MPSDAPTPTNTASSLWFPLHSAKWSAPSSSPDHVTSALHAQPSGFSSPVAVSIPSSPSFPSASRLPKHPLPQFPKKSVPPHVYTLRAAPSTEPNEELVLHMDKLYLGDQQVGPHLIRHLLDEDKELKEEYRRPVRALEIVANIMAPSVEGSHLSLHNAATILRSEYNDDCVVDGEHLQVKERRYTFRQDLYDWFNYVVEGFSLAVTDMLKLEGQRTNWKIDPSGKLMQAALGCSSKSKLCNTFFVLRIWITKVVDLLHHQAALHCGREHLEAPSLTMSDADTQWHTGTE